MKSRIRNFFELIRLPGMFTAHADILAAFLVSGAGPGHLPPLIFLLAATSCLFSSGMVLNDYFDAGIDALERPGRPIPSGRVKRAEALGIGLVLMAAGVLCAFLAGFFPLVVSLGLCAAIFLYDGVLKAVPVVGPMAMASCRYLNFLMGLSIAPVNGWGWIPLITAIYILGITILSQKEVPGGRAVFHIFSSACCMGGVALLYYGLYLSRVIPSFRGVVPVMLFAMVFSARILKLLTENRPDDFQGTIKHLLLSLVILDAVIASGFVPVFMAAPVLLLMIPARYSVRLIRVT